MCDLVEKHLPNNIDPKIVYFIDGIQDICTLTRDKKEKYEELPGL
jgi:Fe-S-cluster formation regulator IscX/YfhJ